MNVKNMTKCLAKKVYGNDSSRNVKTCNAFCDAIVDVIKDGLKKDGVVIWKGFLRFDVVDIPERKGVDLNTHERVVFPPSKRIKCKISSTLKKELKEGNKNRKNKKI